MTKKAKGRSSTSLESEILLAEEMGLARLAFVLSDAMTEAGISQRELAKRMNLTEGRVSQYLGGAFNPNVRTLARISHALGRPLRIGFEESSTSPACQWEGRSIAIAELDAGMSDSEGGRSLAQPLLIMEQLAS